MKIPLREWLKNEAAGQYAGGDYHTQIAAGWYDWFCNDKALARRLKRMVPKVKKIAASPKINQDTMYVWFKNNCSMLGSLYDDFRIADIATGRIVYTITPASGHDSIKGQSEVWGAENDFDGPLYQGDWQGVLTFFEVGRK